MRGLLGVEPMGEWELWRVVVVGVEHGGVKEVSSGAVLVVGTGTRGLRDRREWMRAVRDAIMRDR